MIARPMRVLDSIPTQQLFDRLAKLLRDGWRDEMIQTDASDATMRRVIPARQKRVRRPIGGVCRECGAAVPPQLHSSRCGPCRGNARAAARVQKPRVYSAMTCKDCGAEERKAGGKERCRDCQRAVLVVRHAEYKRRFRAKAAGKAAADATKKQRLDI